MQIALDYPERCLGLVLLSTGPGSGDRPLKATEEMRAQAEQEAQRLLQLGSVEYFYAGGAPEDPGLKSFLSSPAHRRFFDFILEGSRRERLADAIRMRGCDVPPELESHMPFRRRARLSEITLPTLVVLGSQDTTFLPMAEFLGEALLQSQVEVVEGVGHMLNIEAAKIVNDRILEFGRSCANTSQGE